MYKCYKNGLIEEYKRDWIKNQVRDVNNPDFSQLDEEEPPVRLKAPTGTEKPRAEFSRMIR